MLRLLLPKEKKSLRKEYYARFTILACFGASFVLVLWGVSLTPTFVMLQAEERVLQEELRVATDTSLNEERTTLKAELARLSKQLKLLDVPAYHVSRILQTVTSAQTRDVGLSSISFDSAVDSVDKSLKGQLTLSGVASTRSSLLMFKEALEQQSDLITSVDLPFASLVKDAEVPFTITVLLVPVPAHK